MSDLFNFKELNELKNKYKLEFIDFIKTHKDSFEDISKGEFIDLYNEKINALENSLGIDIKIKSLIDFIKESNIIINWLEVE